MGGAKPERLDIGDQHSRFCVLDSEGELLEESRLKTTEDAFAQRFGDAGHEVIVANPRKLHMIFKSDSKNDRFDAHQLARVASLGPKLLYPVQHRGRQARVDQGLIKSRDGLVRAWTGGAAAMEKSGWRRPRR